MMYYELIFSSRIFYKLEEVENIGRQSHHLSQLSISVEADLTIGKMTVRKNTKCISMIIEVGK